MTTTEDSALAISDYSALTDYPLQFSASVDTACVNVSILEEDIVEPDQVFQIYLASYDPVILTPNSSASVTILDNDVLGIGLSSASVMASEVASPLSVAVVILSGSLELDVTVSVAAFSWVNDTATEDFDYRSLNKTITFTSGSGVGSMETFDVIIINDIIVEELLETFTLRLTIPTGAPVAVIGLEVATAFIQEDLTDSVTVSLNESSYVLTEGEGVVICMELVGVLERDAAVNITTVDSTATVLDYIDISTTLTFSSGTSSACVQLSTIDDSTYESTEGLSVELESTDSQVTVATPSVLVTIVDNDDVVLSLSAPEFVCEGDGVVQICVTLETDIERDVEATIETADAFAIDSEDYQSITVTYSYSAPLSSPLTNCTLVTILDNDIIEPCEDFRANLSSPSERAVLSPSSLSIIIHDDEDITSPLLLFNNSPQISGSDLTAYYNLTGCARVTCEVRNQQDCSQPVGSFEGVWFGQNAINRRTLQQFAIIVDAYCPNQIVPVFEDRPIRGDNTQCSQHFTDQQYEFDPVSGNVTVEWEGTGPDATVQVSQFMCRLPNTDTFSCVSPLVITGLSSGSHTLLVTPVGISGCTRMVTRSLLITI
ncbi:uncharacterized protein LOC135339314 isoform X2 [Halichondria panicea]